MKTLIVYYSHSGNNQYLAERAARELGADVEGIRPRVNLLPLQILFSLMRKGLGAARLNHAAEDYDAVVLCSPLWMGRLAYPAQWFADRHRRAIKRFCFATCCGSTDREKDSKFGHGGVFAEMRRLFGGACIHCEAFPVVFALPEEKAGDGDAIMKARLSDGNFSAELHSRLARLAAAVRAT